jgi:hypothetical protein
MAGRRWISLLVRQNAPTRAQQAFGWAGRLAPGIYSDGGGLYLRIRQSGRSWFYIGTLAGQRLEFGLGPAIDISLAKARERADAIRQMLIERKIGMVTDPAKMTEILPVWYVERMGQDSWGFGLLLASGELLAIERIMGVSDDGQWLEVELLDGSSGPKDVSGIPVTYAGLPDHTHGSVRGDQVQAAFELWTS